MEAGQLVMEAGLLWRQYIFAAVANIGIICSGYCMGWSSPMHLVLGNITTSPLDHVLTTEQEAWIGSLLGVGAIFGSFFAGLAASAIGRKWGLISSCIPLFIGWILVFISSSVNMIYAGRFFWGLGGGMVFTISPMYCAEIATDDSRGALGSFLQLFCTIGYLLIYSIGPYVPYKVTSIVGIMLVAIFCVGMFFMPESPIYHLTKKNKEAATACLAKIRGKSLNAVQIEVNKMDEEVTMSLEKTATIADVFRGSNFKAFYISCALLFFQQFSGINAVLFYLSGIFEAAGASLDSSIATIIIGAVLGLLGIYFILADNQNPVAAKLGFLPLLALVLYIVTYCTGVGPLPWAVMSELLPIEVKTIASPLATAFCWFMTFIITRFFSPVAEALGMGFTFIAFGVCCVCGFFFTLFLVPETKGKSSQEIQDLLAKKSSKSSENY